jgi:hypothetical protein
MPTLTVKPQKSFQIKHFLGSFVIYVVLQNVFIYYTTGEQLMDSEQGAKIINYIKQEGFLD